MFKWTNKGQIHSTYFETLFVSYLGHTMFVVSLLSFPGNLGFQALYLEGYSCFVVFSESDGKLNSRFRC